jgi:glycosyltransferase involved in cell wall biosynthesis
MKSTRITPQNAQFVILCFEGPDQYSMAGGLGVRITNIASILAERGFLTHFIFIGGPKLPGQELTAKGRLILHRWCQWISEYYPDGVYQGENQKLYDFNESVPGFVTERIIAPAAAEGKLTFVLGEEWHTAEAMCRLHDGLTAKGVRDRAILSWNANNTFSFHRIPWARLKDCATITTVSRYMKHTFWDLGLNPLVIPNGIPSSLLREVSQEKAQTVRRSLDVDLALCKVARWDPAKGWDSAIETVHRLKERGIKTTLLARGGSEPYGDVVRSKARTLDLTVAEATLEGGKTDYFAAVQEVLPADIVDLRFHLPLEFLRLLYRSCDAVLANSGHEPFGIAGLEAMAVGGLVFTGSTGEDYALHFVNALVMDTGDAREIEEYLLYLKDFPEEGRRIRRAARTMARNFTWQASVSNLIHKLEQQACLQGALSGSPKTSERVLDPNRRAVEAWPDSSELEGADRSQENRL